MNDLWIETGYISLNHVGETLCGDKVEITGGGDDDLTLVLADGLGSGVKANILSTLTSKILCTMISGGIPLEECVSTIASTLPVCSVRQVAYSTFTIIRILDTKMAHIIQFDNPATIVLRHGELFDYPKLTRIISGKTIWESTFPIEMDDVFIAMSDGAEYAGVGQALNFGWTRDSIADYAIANYLPENSAKSTASIIVDECNRLYEGRPGDDTTIAVVRVRNRHPVNLVVGPPEHKEDDVRMMNLFFAKEGTKIVCGGTTSNVVSRYLHQPIIASLDYHDPEVPPISQIKGVDLTTEGVITLAKVLTYAEDFLDQAKLAPVWAVQKDGASLIAKELFENATDINFFVGRAINPAHQNPNLPITFGIKQQLITSLADCLKRMGKHIRLSYF
ncbi:MAG: serine/threonine-protein phosphatase [Clostridiales bacterium]|nr:serine/threonine-protein phosphatase [Clostridiales bacterium]MDO4349367.1 SpoIIE family protein phosphatase [Eubacteriales bacterium]MDY4008222.1 SpoIIE family protein phosphatase [Candidatus Limiplasma sp.]